MVSALPYSSKTEPEGSLDGEVSIERHLSLGVQI